MNLLKRPFFIAGLFLIALSIFIRSIFLPLTNGDLLMNVDWYTFLQKYGYKGLANTEFSNYSPPYLYLLWIGTVLFPKVEPAIVIKIIPSLFDLLSAFTVYKIACLKLKNDKSFFATALFFTLPTVMFNSSGWGQVDSIYGSLVLLCFYFFLTDKSVIALFFYGVAISFKLQSIFFLPFLGILFLRGKIRWYFLLTIPLTYLLFMLPAYFAGRSWESILQIYTSQAGLYNDLARYAPNLYFLIPRDYFHPVFEIGMGIFFIFIAVWGWRNWRTASPVTQNQLILTALASVATVPFLLPKMHDRYFYLADLFSFVVAIFMPQLWFLPILFQISSGLVYLIFPFGNPPLLALPAALINTALVIFVMRNQINSLRNPSLN